MEEHPNYERSSPFYLHANNSSASNFQGQSNNVTSNVSSVGFNNLKKVVTNSSSGSNISTSTLKTNPLTRLFTKNRSVSNIIQPPSQLEITPQNNNSDEDSQTAAPLESKKSQNASKFRLKKSRLFNNKSTNTKPELTIQTGGHHGLKVSKKILSSSSLTDSNSLNGRKNSVSSPGGTFHNLFHRNQNNLQGNVDSAGVNASEFNNKQKTNASSRTSLSLSSNNSNSFVSDIKFASLYKFTDPDHTVEEIDTLNDHTTFFDIHRKLSMPTDQYLQTRTQKGQNHELGLGILGEGIDYESSTDGKNSTRFYENLLYVIRPMLTPSTQNIFNNGMKHAYLGLTIEDVAANIKEFYMRESTTSSYQNKSFNDMHGAVSAASHRTGKSKLKPLKPHRSASMTTSATPIEFHYELFDDLKIREISLDLFTFFVKCMNAMKNDFETETQDENQKFMQSSKMSASRETKQLITLASIWEYFNKKVRFYMLGIFQPLQFFFHEVTSQHFKESDGRVPIDIEIENTLLLAFRDAVIYPFLLSRYTLAEATESEYSSGKVIAPCRLLRSDERAILKSHKNILDSLIECFGEIYSNTKQNQPYTETEHYFKIQAFEMAVMEFTNMR